MGDRVNQYEPWIAEGISEAEYFKKRFIQARTQLTLFDRELRAARECLIWAAGPTREVKTQGLLGAINRIDSFLVENLL